MNIRKLEKKDAPFMLEWMHDTSVTGHLQANFGAKTLDDCIAFIESSLNTREDLHLAVTDDRDEYMGTVSLKHISRGLAEFAITVRTCAMGKGFSQFGMRQILEIGLNELELEAVYWCVSEKNSRAVRFYDKCGYRRVTEVPEHLLSRYSENAGLLWYCAGGET